MRFCDAFNIPLVTFVDVPGFLPGMHVCSFIETVYSNIKLQFWFQKFPFVVILLFAKLYQLQLFRSVLITCILSL